MKNMIKEIKKEAQKFLDECPKCYTTEKCSEYCFHKLQTFDTPSEQKLPEYLAVRLRLFGFLPDELCQDGRSIIEVARYLAKEIANYKRGE